MVIQTCKFCHHARVVMSPNGSQRICSFEPPKLFMMQSPQGMMSAGGWPPVQDTDSCSKFEAEPMIDRRMAIADGLKELT